MNIVIVGNSAAGIQAAETIQQTSPASKVSIITAEAETAYQRCSIDKLLIDSRHSVIYRSRDFYSNRGINLVNQRVVKLNSETQHIVLADGQMVNYDRLVIATGASPARLNIIPAEAQGIFPFHSYQDAYAASKWATNAQQAAIIGGGLAGLKAALALTKRGLKVAIVEKAPHLLARSLNDEAGTRVAHQLETMGIEVYCGTSPLGVALDSQQHIKTLYLDNGSEIKSDLVLTAIGVKPNTELVVTAGGKARLGIQVNDYLETSLPNIYAAGDCIEVRDKITGKMAVSGLWPLAVEQGRLAAYNLLGSKHPYSAPITNLNATQLGTLPVVSVGNISSADEEITFQNTQGNYTTYFLSSDCLSGFIMLGNIENAGVVTSLVRSQRSISNGLKDMLRNGRRLNYGDVLSGPY